MQNEERTLNTKGAGQFAFAATRDAERTSNENAARYSSKERAQANIVRDLLDSAYLYKGLHINFRKTFITVKVDSPLLKDKSFANLTREVCKEKGFEMITTPQGMIVRIMKT